MCPSSTSARTSPAQSEMATSSEAMPRPGARGRTRGARRPGAAQRARRAREVGQEVHGEDAAPHDERDLVEHEDPVGVVAEQQQPDPGGEDHHGAGHEQRGEGPQHDVGRTLGHVDRRRRVVAGEPVAGARELQRNGPDQHQPDEHVRAEQALHVQDRDALGDEQDDQQRGGRAGQQLVELDAPEASARAGGLGRGPVSELGHGGSPAAGRASGRRLARAGRA